MRGTNPPRPQCHRPVVDPRGAEALEALDAPHDVHQSVDGAHLVQGHLLGRYTMNPPLGVTQQAKGQNIEALILQGKDAGIVLGMSKAKAADRQEQDRDNPNPHRPLTPEGPTSVRFELLSPPLRPRIEL